MGMMLRRHQQRHENGEEPGTRPGPFAHPNEDMEAHAKEEEMRAAEAKEEAELEAE